MKLADTLTKDTAEPSAMQSIKNAVFGSSEPKAGEEPVSGETGTGTATEPYDAGNATGESTPIIAPWGSKILLRDTFDSYLFHQSL